MNPIIYKRIFYSLVFVAVAAWIYCTFGGERYVVNFHPAQTVTFVLINRHETDALGNQIGNFGLPDGTELQMMTASTLSAEGRMDFVNLTPQATANGYTVFQPRQKFFTHLEVEGDHVKLTSMGYYAGRDTYLISADIKDPKKYVKKTTWGERISDALTF